MGTPADFDGPGGRLICTGDDLDDGRLTRAIAAKKREHFARVNVDVDATQNGHTLEDLPDVTQRDKRAEGGTGGSSFDPR